jgi:hypothetical protein
MVLNHNDPLARSGVTMELWRVSISRGLLEIVLFRMADGKEWCAPELSDGEQPLKCKKLVLL